MRRDRSLQSSMLSWRVSGRSAITCKRPVVAAAEQPHAHQIEAERAGFGFDQGSEGGDVGQAGIQVRGFAAAERAPRPLHLTM